MRGTVIKRGTTWSVVFEVGRDGAGKRVRKWHSGYRTKREAERARTELLNRLDQGTYVAPTKLTLEAFLVREWLPAKRATVKETTLASYEVHVNKHIGPRLGGHALVVLGPAQLNSFYADLLVQFQSLPWLTSSLDEPDLGLTALTDNLEALRRRSICTRDRRPVTPSAGERSTRRHRARSNPNDAPGAVAEVRVG